MTWKQNTPAGWAWLLFAVLSLLSACTHDLPKLLAGVMLAPSWKLVVPLVNLIGVAGLCQYAIRWRSPRATRWWRGFAPFLLLAYAVMIALVFRATLQFYASVDAVPLGTSVGVGALLAIAVVPAAFIAIAVLRLGDYLGPTRHPLGHKPAQLSFSFS